MPLIEELPVTSTIKASHGWAYVPDTGPIAAQQPGIRDRKRAAAATTAHAANASAKQQKAIQQRLDSLNKENHKDGVTVAILARAGGANTREKAGRKMTSNVRRILTYQRGFAHYLADEEANNPGGIHYQMPNLTGGMGPPPAPIAGAAVSAPSDTKSQKSAANTKDDGRRKSGTTRTRTGTNEEISQPSTPASAPRGRKRGRPSLRSISNVEGISSSASTPTAAVNTEPETPVKSEDKDTDIPMIDADTAVVDTNTNIPLLSDNPSQTQPETDIYPTLWDTDPLLITAPSDVPSMPSDKLMSLLLSEPPLTYAAARAAPLEPEKQRPPRHFCGVCGYWGRVKCRRCEEWTCGVMECWRGHEGVCVAGNVYG